MSKMPMFASIEAVLYPVVCRINEYLSNYILVFLLIGVGLWYTVRTGFVQIRFFGEGMRKVFGNLSLNGGKQSSGMTSFQALATAIAPQVGTGNIVGASGAILTGGPGAIFWMWVIAFFLSLIHIYYPKLRQGVERFVNLAPFQPPVSRFPSSPGSSGPLPERLSLIHIYGA